MNAPTESNAVPATTGGQTTRGRGRGGGRGIPRASTRNAPAKPAVSKFGPNRLLEAEWVKDNVLKQNCFVLFAGAGTPADQQWTFHHPIGETSLEASQWVATPTRDIGYLLMRRESESLASWKRQQEHAKRRGILAARAGRMLGEDQTEVWSFEGAPAIQPTIRSCMTAAKAAGASESEWLNYADQAVRVAEQTFKEAMRTHGVPEDWLRENPKPAHETMGGPLGTNPQRAVPYLNGLSTATAKDKVIRIAIGLEQTDDSDSSDEEEEKQVAKEESPTTTETPKGHTSPKASSSKVASPPKKNGTPAKGS